MWKYFLLGFFSSVFLLYTPLAIAQVTGSPKLLYVKSIDYDPETELEIYTFDVQRSDPIFDIFLDQKKILINFAPPVFPVDERKIYSGTITPYEDFIKLVPSIEPLR